jgi:hypothetical protein
LFQERKKARENVVAVGKPTLRIPLLKSFLILNAGVAGGDWQQSGRFFAQFLPLRVATAPSSGSSGSPLAIRLKSRSSTPRDLSTGA